MCNIYHIKKYIFLPSTVMTEEALSDPKVLLASQVNMPPFRCDILSVNSVPVSSSTLSIIPDCTGTPSRYHWMTGLGNPVTGQLISSPELARVVRLLPTVIAKKSILMCIKFSWVESILGAKPTLR